jgi:hypothetical protein
MRWRDRLGLMLCVLLPATLLPERGQAEGSWSTEFVGNGLENLGGSFPSGRAMAWYDGRLFVGGVYDRAGGRVANGIATWNGTLWSALGSGVWDLLNDEAGSVLALLEHEDQLFIGGSFDFAGGIPAQNLVKWYPPDHWLPAGDINGSVSCMTEYNGDVIVGGGFDHVTWDDEWIYTGNVAGFGASGWYSIAGIGSGTVGDLAVWDGQLVAGGAFWGMEGNYNLRYLARWDGSNWSSFSASGNDEIDGYVKAIAVYRGELYIGGSFWSIGGKPIEKLARWDGVEWQPVGEEVWSALIYGDGVSSFAVYNGALFVSGGLHLGAPWWTDGIMRWDGVSWSTCGAGLNSYPSVWELEAIDDGFSQKLYAGGAFSLADGYIDSKGVAAWIETPVTAVSEASAPRGVMLHPSTPNPFNAQTRVSFTLEAESWVRVDLLDVLGRQVATLAEGRHGPGERSLDWQGRDDSGNALPSGVYLLRLSSPAGTQLQKLVLAK